MGDVEWITSESMPRRIVVRGRAAMCPDCLADARTQAKLARAPFWTMEDCLNALR